MYGDGLFCLRVGYRVDIGRIFRGNEAETASKYSGFYIDWGHFRYKGEAVWGSGVMEKKMEATI